ncbi:MAG: hypothetical protein AAGB02_04980 [Pseudomonadota bacterium]
MEDLQYILGLGFSGADIPQAVLLAFFVAMLLKKDANIWKVGFFVLVVDRVVIPLVTMATAGSGASAVFTSIGAMAATFLDDLAVYIVRYIGIVLMIGAFRWLRARLHMLAPPKKSKPAHA